MNVSGTGLQIKCIQVLTSNFNSGWLALDAAPARPCITFALELFLGEELLDHVASDVRLTLDDTHPGLWVDQLEQGRINFSRTITLEINVQCVGGATMQIGRPILHHVRVLRLGQKDRQVRIQ